MQQIKRRDGDSRPCGRSRRRTAGASTAAGAVISIVFGGALLIASVTHANLPTSLPEAALALASIAALMGCYGFGVCLSCRSFERAKSISHLASDDGRGTERSRSTEMLRCSARPDLTPEELLRAAPRSPLAHSEHLVRPHSCMGETVDESVVLRTRSD